MTLPELLERQAARTPSAMAVVSGDTGLTYAELHARANRLARLLVARGVGPENRVAIAMDRSAELSVALLAVLKAGASYLPLDPAYPPARISYMLADAEVSCVLAERRHLGLIPDSTPCVIMDDDPAAGLPGTDLTDAERKCPLRAAHPAYVIYTSGSTGRPKGVVVAHDSVLNTLSWVAAEFGGEMRRVLATTSVSFDISGFEILGPLAVGGCVELLADLLALADQADGRPGTLVSAVPSAMWHLVRMAGPRIQAGTVVLGGEALTAEVLSVVRAAIPGARIVNAYGPTEATMWATAWRTTTDVTGGVPIGDPLPNTGVLILDDRLRPVPPEATGELYLTGAGLARGYLRRPALTAGRFVASPSGPPGQRMYRTGDLVRTSAAGELVFIGRVDDQVKVRGYRIELGEVESALAALPGVARAVVMVREDRPGDRRLVAYAVPSAGWPLNPVTVRADLARELPGYMVPATVVPLDALPLTLNGKLDRAALPAPVYGALPASPAPAQAAASPAPAAPAAEELLRDLYAEMLGVTDVGTDDSFFDLGGDSLLATLLISRIRSALGVEPEIRAVFDSPGLAELARSLGSDVTRRPALVPRARPDRLPLSFAQQGLWFLAQLEGPSPAYNEPCAWRLTGELDREAVAAALRDVVDRHEALRTVFPDFGGEPAQRILDVPSPAALLTVRQATEADLSAVLKEAAGRAFDLSAELPLRCLLIGLGPRDHVLMIVAHHIVFDGWSAEVLMRDFAAAYRARLDGQAPRWPALPVSYPDYALWQRELLGDVQDPGSVLSRQAQFWRSALAGLPEQIALPFDRPRPAVSSGRGGVVAAEIGPELHAALLELARTHQVTLFMVLQSALATLLFRYGAGADIAIGAPVAGRTDEALHDLIGHFVNTLVLRVRVTGDPSFSELLGQVRETDLAAYAHHELPFERLVETLNPARSTAFHPLFQVMLASDDDATAGGWELPGLCAAPVPVPVSGAKFDLMVSYRQHHGADRAPTGISFTLGYAADLFDEPAVELLGGRLTRLLRQVAADPARRVTAIELLEGGEWERLVRQWNDTARPVPPVTLKDLLETQAAGTPDAVAVLSQDTELSYAQLNRRANQLARELAARGAGPETLIAVAMERSADMIVALLAVLKAGAAFLPLDLEHPDERIGFVLAEAAPAAVIATRTAGRDLPAGPRRMLFDDLARAADERSGDDFACGLCPAHPAYVIFTSGSAGRPKGAVLTHAGIVNYLMRQRADFGVGVGSRVVLKSAATFDTSLWELLTPLTTGATVVVTGPDGHRDPADVVALIRDRQATAAAFTPSLLRVFLSQPGAADCVSLREVRSGGEEMSVPLRDRLHEVLPGVRLYNGYGPTEATIGVFARECLPGETLARIPIGRPVWNTPAFVLDARLRPVPAGVAGELYLGGPQLARGYLNRPGLTAERFVACLSGAPGQRMYRTGDLVRWTSRGELEFLGRVDDQVKIRGYRVEPRETEAVLVRQDVVARAAVVAREDRPGDRRLVAYVVGAPGRSIDPAALRAAAAAALPEYLVPTVVVVLPELPLTTSGKLDRRALPPPDYAETARPSAAPLPRQPAAPAPQIPAMSEVFREVLGADHVGAEDSFFDLGGDSLLAALLVTRIGERFGTPITLKAFLRRPSVGGVLERLGEVNGA